MAAPSSSRRASRLSAYYTREPSPHPPQPSPLPAAAPPELRDRQAALEHADSLSRSLPLDELLSHATHVKSRSDALQRTARSSTRRHYAQLEAAISAAQSARRIAAHVLGDHDTEEPALTQLRRSTDTCAAVNGRLQPTRKRLAELDGVRVVQLLRSAAEMLAKQLPALLAELSLCTDPETARDNMLTAARRFDAVRPAVEHLAKSDSEFALVLDDLCAAAKRVNEALREDAVDALTRVETARVRLLLGEPIELLREQFLADAGESICAKSISKMALGEGACQRAAAYVRFADAEMVPRLRQTAQEYRELFGVKDVVQWEPFLLWAAHLADDAFAANVRRQLDEDVLQKRDDVLKLRAALDEVGKKGANERHEVDDLLRSVVDGLRAALVQAAERERDGALSAMVDGALRDADADGGAVIDAVKDVAQKGEWFACEWDVDALVLWVGRRAVHDALKAGDDMIVGRAALLCERVGHAAGAEGDVGRALVAGGDGLKSRLLRGLCERADELIRTRLEEVTQTSATARVQKGASKSIDALVNLLRDATLVGERCGIECLVVGKQHELLGDEERLGACVKRLFVHRVREVIVEEADVKEVQLDAWRVARVLGGGCFQDVSRALVERCVDGVAPLSEAQAAALAAERRRDGGTRR